jgi:xanthine dehydrogenase YagS FAD-binding subunit
MRAFEYATASGLDEALSLLQADGQIRPLAGGTDLLPLIKADVARPRRLVDLKRVPELAAGIQTTPTGLTIGALTTLSALESDARLRQGYAALVEAIGQAATPQLRNMATLGGNLLQRPRCWYFRSRDFKCLKKGGETCFAREGENAFHAIFGNQRCAIVHPSTAAVALMALGATLEIQGGGAPRQIPIEGFFVTPEQDVLREHSLRQDELITAIRVPAPSPGLRSAYIKQGEKESFDWPIAEVAVALELDGRRCSRASIVLGAAAPVPLRAKEAEARLTGQVVDAASAGAAAEAALAGATPLAQNGYKVEVMKAVVKRTILAAAGGAS